MTFFSFIHQLRKYQSYVSTKITVVLVTDSFRFVFFQCAKSTNTRFCKSDRKAGFRIFKKMGVSFLGGLFEGGMFVIKFLFLSFIQVSGSVRYPSQVTLQTIEVRSSSSNFLFLSSQSPY